MLPSRFLIYFLIGLLFISYCCEAQNEIRNAVRTKTNRKLQEGKTKIEGGKQVARRVKTKVKAPIDRANTNVNRKVQKTRKKIDAIQDIVNS